MIRDDCDMTCAGCERVWCRDADVSPGEANQLCTDCYNTESEDNE